MAKKKKRYKRAASIFCAMPAGVRIYNNCNEPCDALVGPCCCGAWHHRGNVTEICRQKGIFTVFLEEVFDKAILENHERMLADKIARGVK